MGDGMPRGRAGTLISNTLVFAFGNALTKMIQLVLMPLYTTFMSVEEYGVAELVNNMSELLYPLMCLCIFEAAFRFAMDRDIDKSDLFAGALSLLLIMTPLGAVVASVAFFLFSYDLSWVCFALVISVSLRTILAQFARGIGDTRRFAASGVLNTMLLLAFNVAFLVALDLRVLGYICALILSNVGSALYIFLSCQLWRFSKGRPTRNLLRKMLAYSLPLLPNTLAWWFMNIFGRYVLLFSQGPVAAGMYTAASKLPSLVNFLSTIFQQAWQISAAQELESKDGISYFSKVYSAFSSFLYCGCSLLISLSMPIALILLQGEFFDGWRYVPLLMSAALVGCISAFFGTFYNAAKRTGAVFTSTVVGAVTNIALSLTMVQVVGIWGVLVASVMGQCVTLVYRMVDSRQIAPITYNVRSQLMSVLILVVQIALVTTLHNITGLLISSLLFVCLMIYQWRDNGRYIKTAAGFLCGKNADNKG